jgi:uncharacterized protein YlxP (DUF503 family)
MFVGTASIDLHIPDSNSLKEKRYFLRRIKDKVRNKFNVSIAEVDTNDLWQRATLGVAIVANDKKFANQVLSQVIECVKKETGVVILDYSLEII